MPTHRENIESLAAHDRKTIPEYIRASVKAMRAMTPGKQPDEWVYIDMLLEMLEEKETKGVSLEIEDLKKQAQSFILCPPAFQYELEAYHEEFPPETILALVGVVSACMDGYGQGRTGGKYLPPDVRHALEPFMKENEND